MPITDLQPGIQLELKVVDGQHRAIETAPAGTNDQPLGQERGAQVNNGLHLQLKNPEPGERVAIVGQPQDLKCARTQQDPDHPLLLP
ncbi:hypothetical protein FLM9_1109 [Candidatus Synechococcus spongiarum]|uniref:Uncharacterized protein n=1 Tax=Candidatus Synechococcus spongiarum TaxID=431041 RepID=A0A171DH22_9SYNE|nr:hypothetical protein FLM9_1109 [Candidatus Synechococcus spongiarum]